MSALTTAGFIATTAFFTTSLPGILITPFAELTPANGQDIAVNVSFYCHADKDKKGTVGIVYGAGERIDLTHPEVTSIPESVQNFSGTKPYCHLVLEGKVHCAQAGKRYWFTLGLAAPDGGTVAIYPTMAWVIEEVDNPDCGVPSS